VVAAVRKVSPHVTIREAARMPISAAPARPIDWLDVLLGHRTALDLVDEFVAARRGFRLDAQLAVAPIVATSARSDELPCPRLRPFCESFSRKATWARDIGLDLVFALHAVTKNLQVQLAHALIIVCPESSSVRTLKVGLRRLGATAQRPSFSWSALVLGSMATEITVSGKVIAPSAIG